MKKTILALLTLLVFSNVDTKSQIKASREVPSLKIKNEQRVDAVKLVDLKVAVSIFGNIAKTSMTMTFENTTNRDLEGELTFPMPEGVSVSGYALDINGKLRQAVPVDKNKGTEVFESIETRRVDPGLLEKVEGNNFRSRIYPLPSKGRRTIQISYSENLTPESDQALYYYLPLNYNSIIENVELSINVYQGNKKPSFTEQPDGSLAFSEQNHNYTATLQKQQFKSSKNLAIKLPLNENAVSGLKQFNQNGSFYFLANAKLEIPKQTQKKWGNNIAIIWDRSLSSKNRDLEKEFSLLDQFFNENQNISVDLGYLDIRFSKARTFQISQGNWEELRNQLKQTVYDGGTDYSQVKSGVLHGANYLFFSDGLSTFGQGKIVLDQPTYCITSSTSSDYANLKQIAQTHYGKMVNLTNTTITQAYNALNSIDLLFLGVKEQYAFTEIYPEKGSPVQSYFSVSGLGKDSGAKEITLLVGDGTQIIKEIKVPLKPDNGEIDLQQIWAQKKINALDIQYDDHRDEIEAIGKQFGIVTRNTSLIVLENVEDYIRYAITPPAELLPEFNRLIKEERIEKEERVADLLTQAQNITEQLQSWWNTDFQQKTKYPQRDRSGRSTDTAIVQDAPTVNIAVTPMPSRPSASPVATPPAVEYRSAERASDERVYAAANSRVANATASEVVLEDISSKDALKESVTVNAVQALEGRVAGVQPTSTLGSTTGKISIPEIKEDNAYLKELNQSKDPYKSYLQLRDQYMGTPTFYFDVANFFFKKGDRQKALLILSALADLQIENADLYKTISYKLREWGDVDNALYITTKVLKWRPMDPQSHRDYALALQDKGQYKEALEQLYGILTQSYSPEAANRDDGIEEILVMEINNLIKLQKSATAKAAVEKKLVADLPVDIRVVLNWNSQNTDIDLWVTDPNGEKCFYSNPATAIGGRLSNDFTGGYGPEQFLLKKALKGKYKIEADFYNDSSLTLAGPAAVLAEIFTYYSSGRQERKLTTIYLDRDKERNILVGEFVF
ncbi:VIT domain-containing protein [Sphingobacterium detergens]|uniref:Vault protein inter-alpha-trypsin-like protein n=1 Tax=Sphingobacterium detergens TaxID=1145106 RepID=A0A420AJ12_SPHD1|nr:VIT domain-containing protein [Sphingobacterium detergens]RKE44409.1 vault protein inter-alpha-trypsin-like protein [Sphingobacterium detergens]